MDHTHEIYLLDLPQNRPTRRCPVSLRMRSDSRSGLFKAVHNVHPPTRIGTFARSPNFRTAVPVADIVRAFRPNEVKGSPTPAAWQIVVAFFRLHRRHLVDAGAMKALDLIA